MEPVLEARGLTKRFGAHAALTDMNLALPAGEIFGLLGPNGAGKSTTINLFMGFLQPTRGTAKVCGIDCATQTRDAMRIVGHMPEEPSLFENLTGRETAAFVLSMRGEDRPSRREAVDHLARRLGFSGEMDQLVAGYSMGMRKKLALLLALSHDPRVLLLDEPTNGLDPVVAREVREILRERAERGVTVVLSTHLLDVAQRVCHRLGLIVKGHLRAVGTPEEVLRIAGTDSLEEAFLSLTTEP